MSEGAGGCTNERVTEAKKHKYTVKEKKKKKEKQLLYSSMLLEPTRQAQRPVNPEADRAALY